MNNTDNMNNTDKIEYLLFTKTQMYNFVTTYDMANFDTTYDIAHFEVFKILISKYLKIQSDDIMWLGDKNEYKNEMQSDDIRIIYNKLSTDINAFKDIGHIELLINKIDVLLAIAKIYVLKYGDFGASNMQDIHQHEIEKGENGDLKIIFRILHTKQIPETLIDQIVNLFDNSRLYKIIISNTGEFISGKTLGNNVKY